MATAKALTADNPLAEEDTGILPGGGVTPRRVPVSKAATMKNNGRFDRTFANRMMELVRLYRGPHEGSNLFTCLLGLLLVPGEEAWSRVPDEPLSNLRHWGISRRSIKKIGTCPCGNKHPRTLRHLVEILRNAIADHQFDLLHANGKLTGLELKDASGFHAVLKTADLRRLVEKLAEHVGGSRARGDSGDTDFVASWQREPFHRRSCKWVRRIRRRNRLGVATRREAIRAGHRPCKTCRP